MPQRAKNTVNDLSVILWYRSRFWHKARYSRLASQFPLFSSWDQQAAVGSLLRIEVILPNTAAEYTETKKEWSHEGLSDILEPPFANRQNCSHNRTAKRIKISCFPRESLLNYSWPSWILPQVIRDMHISSRLSCPWFLAERDYCSKSIDIISTPECPDIKTQSTVHVLNLTSDRFCLLLAITCI